MKEINQLDNAEEIRTLTNSWEERGKKKGREEGVEEGIEKVARGLIREGFSTELIAKVTHLNKDEIERLKEKLDE